MTRRDFLTCGAAGLLLLPSARMARAYQSNESLEWIEACRGGPTP
jgi:hypothetical protein